jgi:hypothetical protein
MTYIAVATESKLHARTRLGPTRCRWVGPLVFPRSSVASISLSSFASARSTVRATLYHILRVSVHRYLLLHGSCFVLYTVVRAILSSLPASSSPGRTGT